jgi:hypothetical protein
MKPIDVAEKWQRAAWVLHEQWETPTPEAETLARRVVAHYGQARGTLHQIVTVAMLEAMSEYQAIRDAPLCHMCAQLIMPNENATELPRGGYVHADKPECTFIP